MATWSVSVNLGGVDISSRLTGQITVEAEASTARIGAFIMVPPTGSINPGDWVNSPVTIDHINDPDGVPVVERLFAGFVNRSDYDPVTGIVAFNCTDHLQNHFETMTEAQILAAIPGGRYSTAVFGDRKDGWSQALDVLNTVSKDYDLNRDGITPTVTDWESKPSPDFSYDESSIIDGSVQLELIRLRDLVNKVVISSKYRYTRLHHRQHRYTWDANIGFNPSFEFCDYFFDSYELPTRDMIQSAAEGAGWNVRGGEINFESLPDTGSYTCGGGPVGWAITEELQNQLVVEASWFAAKRWSQTITERYTVTVQESGSITQHGELLLEDGAGERTEFDDAGWDASTGSQIPDDFSQNVIDDYTQDQIDRTVSDNMLLTLIQVADVDIKNAHRQNFVTWRTELEPTIERSHTAEMNGATIQARGKLFQYIHTMDIDAGSAITEIKIAVSTCWPGGSQDIFSVPAAPDTQPTHPMPDTGTNLPNRIGNDDTAPSFDEEWVGSTGDFTVAQGTPNEEQMYPRRFRIVTPDIEPESRDEVEREVTPIIETKCIPDFLVINTQQISDLLIVHGSKHSHVVDNIDLGASFFVNETTHDHTAAGVTLVPSTELVDSTLHSLISDEIILSATTDELPTDESTHDHTVDNISLTLGNPLLTNDSLHAHTADNVVVTTIDPLLSDDSLHQHSVDNTDLTSETPLSPDDSLLSHITDNTVLSLPNTLSLEDALHGHTVGDPFRSYYLAALDTSPVGYWRLGEGSGVTAASEVNTPANDGTIQGAVTLGVTGALTGDTDTAFSSSASNAYVQIPGGIWTGTGDFTIAVWINTTDTTNQMKIWDRHAPGSFDTRMFLSINRNSSGVFQSGAVGLFTNSGGPSSNFGADSVTVNDGNWHFIVAGRSGSSGFIYVDGSSVTTAGAVQSGDVHDGNNFRVAADSTLGPTYFRGSYDEVKFYDKALTLAEVADLYLRHTLDV